MDGDPWKALALISGAAWLLVSLWPVARRSLSPPDLAFSLFASLLGTWATIDYVFLTAADLAFALLISKVRITVFTLAILFLLYWAKWLTAGRRRWDALFLVPVALTILLNWTVVTYGIERQPWGPRVLRDPAYYALWVAQVVAYISLALYYLFGGIRSILRTDRRQGLRIAATIASIFLFLGIWASTNMLNNLTRSLSFPYLSSLLWIPAATVLAFLVPVPSERLRRLWHGMAMAGGRRVVAACLLDAQGNILGVAAAGKRELRRFKGMEDVMEVIDQFMVTAFSAGEKHLRTVVVGDVTFIVERKGDRFLVLAVHGGYSDVLRRDVQEALGLLSGGQERTKDWDLGQGKLEEILQRLVAAPGG